jgi:hypothetical protein
MYCINLIVLLLLLFLDFLYVYVLYLYISTDLVIGHKTAESARK